MGDERVRGRIFGLDVMRATGGLMVVLAHTGHLVAQHWPRFPMVPPIDWVDLFFLLSGFLIGGILLDTMAEKGTPAFQCADFLQRRWLRSLPNYYLFLGLNVWLVHADLAPGLLTKATWGYVVFMQNFHVPLDLFFWESWSLAVEEWFYLLFPLIALGAVALLGLSGRRGFLLACVAFIIIPVVARYGVAQHVTDPTAWSLWVKKLVITRLDAPGLGMLAAWVARGWAPAWKRARWPAFLIGLGLLSTVGIMRYDDGPGFTIYYQQSIAALSVTLLLPLLSTWRSGGWLSHPIRRMSLITYALYLVHMPMLYLFGDRVPDPLAWKCALHYAVFLAVALGISALIFKFWERPFMQLRAPIGQWLTRQWAHSGTVDRRS